MSVNTSKGAGLAGSLCTMGPVTVTSSSAAGALAVAEVAHISSAARTRFSNK
jgi:hypothetical protein